MRGYLVTPRERHILETYIEQRIKLDGFSVLAIRLKHARKILENDYELIEEALRRMDLE
jgi:hypothetical protein